MGGKIKKTPESSLLPVFRFLSLRAVTLVSNSARYDADAKSIDTYP
jgi:hypothetical protein